MQGDRRYCLGSTGDKSKKIPRAMPGLYGAVITPLLVLAVLFVLSVFSTARAQDKEDLLTLREAIDNALKNQPSIAAARYVVRASEARIGEAQSGYYPQLSGSGTYSRISPASSGTRSLATGTGTTASVSNADPYDSYSASVGASQLIYDFGKTSTQVKISKFNADSARLDLTNTQEGVILNVKQAYYNALQAIRNREVTGRAVAQFQQHLDQAKGFFEVGTKAKFDVTKAEVDLSNAKVNLINAENQVRLAYVALKNAMGMPNAPDYGLEDTLIYEKYTLPFEQAIEKAYAQRPDLLSAIKKKEASKESINLARKGYFPTLTGSANYSYTGSDFPLRNGWNYGLGLSVPIFSGFLTKHQVSEAQANYGAVSANEESLRLDIYSQVNQAYLTLRAAEERISAAELGVRQAKENVDLATGRYDAGVGGPLEVTDAIVAQSNAELSYTSALTDYKNAQAALEKAIGEKP